MSTLLTLRTDVQATLDAGLADTVAVYSYPAETVVMPAVVFVPGGDWWTPAKLGPSLTDGNVRVAFDLQLLVARGTELAATFDMLESLAVAVAIAAADLPLLRFQSLSRPEPTKVNDLDALMVRMAFTTTV